ncbi:MAG: DUF4830 domain-containing protein [Acutalibacteraceae bacterium]|nr:DUF4830 domain-containing protein [Acutalibacteraceae bacterium]
MISFTAKITKARFFTAIAVILIPLLIFSAVYISRAAENKKQVVLAGATAEQRAAFLKQYGWEIDSSDETVKDTVIPSVFDNVYDAYNSIQVSQGFDLSEYKGKAVKLYNIKVNNYPKNSEYVYATLIVLDGVVIGGDIHSTELNGFMHGFELD